MPLTLKPKNWNPSKKVISQFRDPLDPKPFQELNDQVIRTIYLVNKPFICERDQRAYHSIIASL